MAKAKPGDWNPLEDAKWIIDKLKNEVNKCDATGMANHSAGAFGNIEAAFYRNDIDEVTMEKMKNDVTQSISYFGLKCICQHRRFF